MQTRYIPCKKSERERFRWINYFFAETIFVTKNLPLLGLGHMGSVMMIQRNKIHPHKFTLWTGMGSIIMMFAGLTSAYIVKRNQVNWVAFDLPQVFWYSTAVIVASSFAVFFAGQAFKRRKMFMYRGLLTVTLILGVLFLVMQVLGFQQLWAEGITLQASVSYSFLYVIVGLHGVHVIGGIIALLILIVKAFNKRIRDFNIVPVELVSTYWHFVDVLWVYLLIFLLMIR